MLTYSEVMTTDLGKLTAAADKWDDAAAEIKKVENRYKDSVQCITLGPSWSGLSANTAQMNFAATRYEYAAAQTQAKAIASLLRDAHNDFVRLKKNLENQCAAAVTAGMQISESGVVTYDYAKLTKGELAATRHDPDYAESIRKSVASWSKAIDDCVKAVDDADQGVKIALEAVTRDGYGDKNDNTLGTGFNAHAQGDVEKYEAENTKDIATRINNGDKVSAADMAEFQRSVRDNSHDKTFSQTLLNGLGPDGLIKVTNKLNDRAYDSDKKNKAQYLEIQKGLANSAATATQVPGSVKDAPPGSEAFKRWVASDDGRFYREFTKELHETGTENFARKDNPLYGYQSFVSLMQQADTDFDDQFLYEMGDKLIAAEKDKPGLFTEWGPGHKGIETDAIDGLLGVMSKNPDAATAFFDPAGNGADSGGQNNHVGNNHLEYLVGDGGDSRDWPKHVVLGYANSTFDDPTNRMGLGAALEAAATGHEPLPAGRDPWPEAKHDEAQARVMNGILEQFAPGKGEGTEATVPDNLRAPVADALAEYASDTHEIIGAVNDEYTNASGEGHFAKDGNGHLATNPKDLIQVMRGLSENPDAYAALHKAEARHLNNELDRIPNGATGFAHSGNWDKAGSVLGTYTAIREDVINDERMAGYSEADWKSKVAYHVIGGAVTPLAIPTAGGSIVVGDALQRGVDVWAWQWGNDMKAGEDAKANAEIADLHLKDSTQITNTVQGWAAGRSDIDLTDETDQNTVTTLKTTMLGGADRGEGTAHKYLADTTS
ncbi:hypothetical protein OG413_00740 [Streptomyces sp. NBC_01433]|uniref:DUF6571 family protein n=1 Tax=Streptomyces sp. NBC_01433 TaxID=2903864 RepID=UPI002253EA68|nr:DUF6571 family protein [Streptomyces sp. NBC_01433]MCX4673862.1 hypothetical protein [Streptomyces sp. NBC_01433]